MASNDPFRGIKLSEQATSAQVEQRLFSDPPKNTPPEPQKPAQKPSAPIKQSKPSIEPPKPVPVRKLDLRPASLVRSSFDLDDEALYKASYVFTIQELEALEDLKLELRRELDSKITKNDLIRAALHMLVEDYRDNAARSYIRRKARRR